MFASNGTHVALLQDLLSFLFVFTAVYCSMHHVAFTASTERVEFHTWTWEIMGAAPLDWRLEPSTVHWLAHHK